MPIPAATPQGVVTGKFTIPPNVPAGAKRVTFRGVGGSFGEATFIGRGKITTEERRVVNTITTTYWDPLAQTFTLREGRHLAGVEVMFTAFGDKANAVIAEIREVENGLPTRRVIAQSVLRGDALKTAPAWTRFEFPPVFIEADRECALVLLTDDPKHAVAIAELGKYDPATGWITQQPYQVGVLLSSSNASTWTPHNDKDMAFRLLGARFSSMTAVVPLGTISAADASDLIALANVERPAADCNVEFVFTLPNGSQVNVGPSQIASLPAKVNGNISVSAVLKGSAIRSPVMYPGFQPILGKLKDTGTYVSRAFSAGNNVKVAVTLDVYLPGTATIIVEAQKQDGTYVPLTLASASPVGDGFEERSYTVTGLSATNTRIRLTLSGSALYRPKARKLRAVVT